jgi:hypothetical protein
MNPIIKKTLLASSVALALSAPAANAVLMTDIMGPSSVGYDFSTNSANFTMLTAGGFVVGGTNDVSMLWDGNAYTSSSDYIGPGSASNVTASSTTPFFGSTVAYTWTAHDIQVFVPGSYSFDTSLGGGNGESGILNVTVPTGQIGMHMLFNWNGNNNIDVFVVAAMSGVFGSGLGFTTQTTASGAFRCGTGASGTQELTNCLYDGKNFGTAGKPLGSKVWQLVSVDGNGDGIMGIPMAAGGPFANFNANFMASMNPVPETVVPVPAAVWLFGSGLMGLAAVARRKKKA